MSLDTCLESLNFDPEDAAELQQLAVRSADDAGAVDSYIAGLQADEQSIRDQLTDQGIDAQPQTLEQAAQEIDELVADATEGLTSGQLEQLDAAIEEDAGLLAPILFQRYEMLDSEADQQRPDGTHPFQMSTRVPTGKDTAGEAVQAVHDGQPLSIGIDQILQLAPPALEKIASVLRSTPGFKTQSNDPTAVIEEAVEHVVDNLTWLHDLVLDQYPEYIERSHKWYDGARRITTEWSKIYGVPDRAVAAVLASLSPQMDWFKNVTLAQRVLDIHSHLTTGNTVNMPALDSMKAYAESKYAPRKRPKNWAKKSAKKKAEWLAEERGNAIKLRQHRDLFSGELRYVDIPEGKEGDIQRAMWLRAYDEAENPKQYRLVTPEGAFGELALADDGVTPLKAGWGSFREIGKAIAVLRDPSVEGISSYIGNEHKVRNFYNNILSPNSPYGEVTIDTHAVAASWLLPLGGSDTPVIQNFGGAGAPKNAVTGSAGVYGVLAEAHRRVANNPRIARLPRQVQSITWEAIRSIFLPSFKNNVNKAAVEAIWAQYERGAISKDAARSQILEIAGGLRAPKWASSDDSRDTASDPSRTASYDGELAQSNIRSRQYAEGLGATGVPIGDGDALGIGPQIKRTLYQRDNNGQAQPDERPDSDRPGRGSLADAPVSAEQGAVRLTGQNGRSRLKGLEKGSPGAVPGLREAAADYARKAGIEHDHQAEYAKIDAELAQRIAQAYEDMQHAPNDPAVQASYDAMIRETLAQYEYILELGYTFSPMVEGFENVYPTVNEALEDMSVNKHLWFFPTDFGYGTNEDGTLGQIDDSEIAENPLLAWTDYEINGQRLRANDVFRIVHDVFGHGLEGSLFRGRGEENAWQAHIRLYSDEAAGAVTSETRGQNSWLNFGPSGEANRTASTEDTVFAEQKIGLMPEWTWREGRAVNESEAKQTHEERRSILEANAAIERTAPAPVTRREQAVFGLRRRFVDESSGRIRGVTGGRSRDGENGRLVASDELVSAFTQSGFSAPAVVEADAATFVKLIEQSKAESKFGAAVYVYPESAYKDMQLWVTDDGKAGFAVKPDGDIVSVFNLQGSPHKGVVPYFLALAVHQGGTKLDAFDTILPYLYAASGFIEVGRDTWNEEYKPDGWDYKTFEGFSFGRPGVVYMENRNAEQPYRSEADLTRTLFQPAFHGTPHKVDRFSLQKIGTGEGAQAYGWGLYFAESQDTAESYRDFLSPMRIEVEGHIWDSENPRHHAVQAYRASGFDAVLAAAELNKDADNMEAHLREVGGWDFASATKKFVERDRAAAAILEAEGVPAHEQISTGNIYTVDIADGAVENMLDWDAPLSEQPEAVRAHLPDLIAPNRDELLSTLQDLFDTQAPPGYSQERFDRVVQEALEFGGYGDEFGTSVWDEINEATGGFIDGESEFARIGDTISPSDTGRQLYQLLDSSLGGADKASARLNELGIPGIKYWDSGSRAAGEGTRNFVVWDEDAITMLQENGQPVADQEKSAILNQPATATAEADPLGSTEFQPEKTIITLFERADKSTFLHESGHVFVALIERMALAPNAPQRIRDIYTDMLKLVGAQSAYDMDAFDPTKTKEERKAAEERQEILARSFEKYLMEGKAPSPRLKTAFATFRRWLTFIYTRLRRLGTTLSPEINDVFDRMLATDEELQMMRESAGIDVNASPTIAAMMEGPEAAAYLAAKDESEELDRERLLQVEAELEQAEKEAAWQAAYEAERKQVAAELWAMPQYKAWLFLTGGTLPAESDAPIGRLKLRQRLQGQRLDKKALTDAGFSAKELAAIPRGPRGKAVYTPNGASPELLASALGYEDGAALVAAMRDLAPPQDIIDNESAKRVRQKLGDPANDGTRERLIREGLYHEARQKVILAELNALAKIAGKPKTTRVLAKAMADEIISLTPLRDLLSPLKYEAASVRHAQEAERRAAAGDTLGAYESKQLHLLNHEMFRKGLKIRDEVRRQRKRLRKLQTGKIDPKRVSPEYIGQLKNLLNVFGLKDSPKQFQAAGRIPQESQALASSVMGWIEAKQAQGEALSVPGELATVGDFDENGYQPKLFLLKHWSEMTAGEFSALNDLSIMIENIGRRNSEAERVKRGLFHMELQRSIREKTKARPRKAVKPGYIATSVQEAAAAKKNWFLAAHRKIESFIRELDGFDDMGPMWRALFRPLQAGEDAKGEMSAIIVKAMGDIFGAYGFDERRRMSSNGATWYQSNLFNGSAIQVPGISASVSLSHEQRLVIALNAGNESSLAALLADEALKDDFTPRDRDGNAIGETEWNAASLQIVLDMLTGKDKKVVRQIFELVDSFWEDIYDDSGRFLSIGIKNLEKQETGVVPPKVAPLAFTSNGEAIAGGYYPLKYNPHRSERVANEKAADIMSAVTGGNPGSAMTSHNHTLARKGSGGRPIRLGFDALMEHFEQVTQDLAFRQAVINADRILKDPGISDAIKDVIGESGLKEMRTTIMTVAQGSSGGVSPADKTWRWFRLKASNAIMGLNLRSVLSQPLGLFQSLSVIGPVYFARGLIQWYLTGSNLGSNVLAARPPIYSHYKQTRQVFAKSVFMRRRARSATRELNEVQNKIGIPGVAKAVQKVAFAPMMYLDVFSVAMPTWLGAYEKAMAGNAKGVRAGDEASAIEYADMAVRRSQGTGGNLNLANIQSQSELGKLITMFGSYFNTTYQLQTEAWRQIGQSDGVVDGAKNLAGWAYHSTILTLIPGVLGALLLENFTEEDEKKMSHSEWLALQTFLYATGQVFLVRDIASATASGFDPSLSPAESVGKAAVGGVKEVVQMATSEDYELDAPAVKAMARAVGFVGGVPGTNQIIRSGEWLHKYEKGDLSNPVEDVWTPEGMQRLLLTGDR
jgi:hypothetical protein